MANKMTKAHEAFSYAEKRKSELTVDDFHSEVKVQFIDAYMEIRWAFVERRGDFVFVFGEHYPPILQHVDETEWFVQHEIKNEDNKIKKWENPDHS